MAQMHHGRSTMLATGTELMRPLFLIQMAAGRSAQGQTEVGLHLLAEALALLDTTGEHFWKAELYRYKGELLLQTSVPRLEFSPRIPHANEAEACFHQALDIARRQQAKSLELRTATSLARLWQQQGKRQPAHELLAPVYGWFTEGFDTADLQAAKALLDALA
jgi:predicted ATPase